MYKTYNITFSSTHFPIHWILEEIPPNIKWQSQTDTSCHSIYDKIIDEYNQKTILFV
jgi:hypothetical protein